MLCMQVLDVRGILCTSKEMDTKVKIPQSHTCVCLGDDCVLSLADHYIDQVAKAGVSSFDEWTI